MAELAPLAEDTVPWLVEDQREVVSGIVRQCDSVTILAYRDRAVRILADISGITELCVLNGKRYRVGVETQQPSESIPGNTTFGDDGEAVLARELAGWPPAYRGRCSTASPFTPCFLAVAPVRVYSRPADTVSKVKGGVATWPTRPNASEGTPSLRSALRNGPHMQVAEIHMWKARPYTGHR